MNIVPVCICILQLGGLKRDSMGSLLRVNKKPIKEEDEIEEVKTIEIKEGTNSQLENISSSMYIFRNLK